jgi:hypothetical protein
MNLLADILLDTISLATIILPPIGLGLWIYFVIYQQYLAWRWGRKSQEWPSIQGKVTSSKVRSDNNRRSSRRNYYPEIRYEYTIEDKVYRGKRYQFGISLYYYGQDLTQAILHEYNVGKKVKVYYNPDNPKLATLQTGISGWVLIPGFFICTIGIVAFLFWILKVLGIV